MRTYSPSALKKALTGKRVLVDTNIIIYLTDAVQPFAQASRSIFQLIEHGDLFAVFSILSVAEVMQGPLRRGLIQNAMDAKTYLLNFPNSTCQDITTQVIEEIGKDQRIQWKKLRTIDTLIIASGLVNQVDLIISNDAHFQSALPEDLIFSLT
ncbi:MAG: putative nucleic acid-binding protein contains domain [Deltaproteobacteria bacterium]|jgi:predicted nucleic acid-binding protein|nr:putative nucleic acid-binding protein contains domain [Deltaproteobacteria bacterium]